MLIRNQYGNVYRGTCEKEAIFNPQNAGVHIGCQTKTAHCVGHALNLALKGACYEENVHLNRNFAKGTTHFCCGYHGDMCYFETWSCNIRTPTNGTDIPIVLVLVLLDFSTHVTKERVLFLTVGTGAGAKH